MRDTPALPCPISGDLRTEVEGQLLADLAVYGVSSPDLWIDWGDWCPEGHCTWILGEILEELSDIVVRDASGVAVAEGWFDFIHGGGNNPLFVFWLFLTVIEDSVETKVKSQINIPEHVWRVLPDRTRDLCAFADGYDGRWKNDPLVTAWRDERSDTP